LIEPIGVGHTFSSGAAPKHALAPPPG
jgi:hypothetical protein